MKIDLLKLKFPKITKRNLVLLFRNLKNSEITQKHKVRMCLFVISFLVIFLSFAFYLYAQVYFPKDYGEIKKVFTINKGEGVLQISQNLENEGLIKSSWAFRFYLILKRKASSLQAGTYLLSSSKNIAQIFEKLTSGEVIKFKITIPEGYTLVEIGERMEKEGIASKEDFLKEASKSQKYKEKFDFLSSLPSSKNLEGFLFPDTYFFQTEASPEEIISKMLSNFGQKLSPELRQEVSNRKMTIYQFITLASIVEKEVPNFEDRRLVAGIFYKRLKKGGLLQSCATVEYVLRTGKRVLAAEDLKVDSPYNTYLYPGLPPSPISNPGMEAILATLRPKSSEYWYFLSPNLGKTLFFRTFEEQEEARAKYLK